MAGLIWHQGDIVEQAAVGVRIINSDSQINLQDNWHLGSISKSFTALLTAKLVEDGYLDWHQSLDQLLPEIDVSAKYKSVTPVQLLNHTAGMMTDLTKVSNWQSYFSDSRPIKEQRKTMVISILNQSTKSPGDFRYSNAGYVVIGAILEQTTGKSWEQLIREYIFTPLNLTSAQFGAPNPGSLQPHGHKKQQGTLKNYDPELGLADNPVVIGPAGRINMNLDDLLTYTKLHLAGAQGRSNFLSTSSFTMLHKTNANSNYALGWFVDGSNHSHAGSNTLWYMKLGWEPIQQIIVIAATNQGGDEGDSATDDVINNLLKRHQQNK